MGDHPRLQASPIFKSSATNKASPKRHEAIVCEVYYQNLRPKTTYSVVAELTSIKTRDCLYNEKTERDIITTTCFTAEGSHGKTQVIFPDIDTTMLKGEKAFISLYLNEGIYITNWEEDITAISEKPDKLNQLKVKIK